MLPLNAFATDLPRIGNILILRGDIEILPLDRENVSYDQLAQLLAEHLLKTQTDVDIDSALATMPVTRSTHPPH
jgi:ubiquitin carboxyl-terminal hydrolase MINDY-1/2